jgi:predicted DNA-binding transcriptional regulator AlpA
MPTLETSLSLREDPATAANLVAVAADTPVGRIWIPAPQLAAELGVSRRTLARWILDLALEFPRPKIVNHRLYFSRGDVEAWKAATAVKAARAR